MLAALQFAHLRQVLQTVSFATVGAHCRLFQYDIYCSSSTNDIFMPACTQDSQSIQSCQCDFDLFGAGIPDASRRPPPTPSFFFGRLGKDCWSGQGRSGVVSKEMACLPQHFGRPEGVEDTVWTQLYHRPSSTVLWPCPRLVSPHYIMSRLA